MNQNHETEHVVWSANPSHFVFFSSYCIAALLTPLFGIGLFYAVIVYLQVTNTKYELTSQRFRLYQGVFSRVIHELELYRVIDNPLLEAPFILNLFNLSNITVYSSDHTFKKVILAGIRNGEQVQEIIRNTVEKIRTEKNVRMVNVEKN